MGRRNPTAEFVQKGLTPGDAFRVEPIPDELVFKPLKRVAIFTEAFLPKIDGVTRTAALVVRHLQQSGREVIIFTPEFEGLTPTSFGPSQVVAVPSLELPMVPETKIGIPSAFINDYLDDFQPQLMHLFSPATLSLSGLWYGQFHVLPIIANYQTDLPGYARRYGMSFLSNPIKATLRGLHNNSHLTLAPTHSVIRQLEEWGFERLRLWGRGVDADRFNPAFRNSQMRTRLLNGHPEESLLVLYVGRLAIEKNLDLLDEVVETEGVAVAVVGDGENRTALEERWGDRVCFTGYLFDDDLAAAYASADVFAFTGTNETFGQVVTEAMASGLPALVPNSGGVVDLVLDGMNGFICQVDPADYARHVICLRDNPERRRRMGERALEYARSRPWTDVMTQLETYYEEAWHLNRSMKRGIFNEFLPESV